MQNENGEKGKDTPRNIVSGGRLGDDGQYQDHAGKLPDYDQLTGRTPGDDGPVINLDGAGPKEDGLPGEPGGVIEEPPPIPLTASQRIELACADYTVEDLFETINALKNKFNLLVREEMEKQAAIVLDNEQKLNRLQTLNHRLNNA